MYKLLDKANAVADSYLAPSSPIGNNKMKMVNKVIEASRPQESLFGSKGQWGKVRSTRDNFCTLSESKCGVICVIRCMRQGLGAVRFSHSRSNTRSGVCYKSNFPI
jgi:hypothetical protein